jgi:hypothetical protein
MRIGIYTQPLRYNYGGILQAYALQEVLRRMGHEAVTFRPYPHLYLEWHQKPIVYTRRFIKKMLGFPTCIHLEEKMNRDHFVKMRNLQPFISKSIKLIEYRTVDELKETDYDVLIAGSDQVWRPRYNVSYGRTIENAFFDFAKDWKVKRLAYAASFGTDKWEFSHGQTQRCSQLVKMFDAVGVREFSAISLCKKYFDVNAVHVLDPTLLLSCSDYEEIIKEGQPSKKPEGNLLCYILEEKPDTTKLIELICQEKNLIPFRANSYVENGMKSLEDQIQPSVEQWLRDFQEADFVVTDSFHATVFSIIFKKPFVVIGNKERGISRYASLLGTLSLDDHFLTSVNDFDCQKPYSIPDSVYERLKCLQEESISFLEKSLK